MASIKTYLVIAILLSAFSVSGQCPASLAVLLAGGTFHDGSGGPINCNYAAGGAITTGGNINFTGSLTLTNVSTFTIAHNVVWNGGLLDIQGLGGNVGNLTIGNGTTGSLTIASGTVQANDASNGTITVAANGVATIAAGASMISYLGPAISNGGTVNNSGSISNGSGNITVTGTLNNFAGASATAVGNFSITAGTGNVTTASGSSVACTNFFVNGTLNAGGTITTTSQFSVTATGSMTSSGAINVGTIFGVVAGGTATNSGTITSASSVSISGTLNNSGTLQSTNSTVTVNGTLNTTGQINATHASSGGVFINGTGTLLVDVGGAVSTRTFYVASGASATVNATGQITTSGTGDNTITGTLTNSGALSLGGDLVVDGATANVTMNAGSSITINRSAGDGDLEVTNGATFTMNGGNLSVQDDITTWIDGNVTASSGNFIINGSSIVTVVDDIILTGGSFQNDGSVSADDINMSAGTFHNTNDLTINDGDIALSGGTFENDGNISVFNDLLITGGNFYNDETMTVDDMIVSGTGSLTSHEAGAVITLADQYSDVNCPYANGIYHYCSCIGNPSDADGVSAICASALPIELLDFSGSQKGNEIQLSWTTATETNNHFFTIEKLRPSDTFEEVVRVPGAGTTVLKQHYSAIDPNPSIGKNYYRLKQTDFDLKTSYSELIKVVFESYTFVVQVYPNPVTDKNATVFVQGMQGEEWITLELKNTLGQTILSSLTQANTSGSAEVVLALPPLSPGVYIVNVNGKSQKILVR